MLIVAMHNRRDYLDSLVLLAKKANITDARIVEEEDIGVRLIGESTSFIFRKGHLSSAYDKAFVAVIKEKEKTKQLLDLIENDSSLRLLNLEDKGFICTLPFQEIKNLKIESSYPER